MSTQHQLRERRRRYVGPGGEVEPDYDGVQPTLEPGGTVTSVPPWWCAKCERSRGGRRCGVCGGQTVAREELPQDPAADAVAALAELQNVDPDVVNVTVQRLEPTSLEAVAPPPDPADLVYAQTVPAAAPPAAELEQSSLPELELDDEAEDLPPGPAIDEQPQARPRPGSILDRLKTKQSARAATVRSDERLVGATYRETRIMTRPKSPMSRGVVDRARGGRPHPLRDNDSPQRSSHTMQPAQRSKDLDERGREVQRTMGRSKRGSIEDKLLKLWETANVDRGMWSGFLAAALQRLVPNEAGELEPISVEEAAELADACYMQLLLRDNAATGA